MSSSGADVTYDHNFLRFSPIFGKQIGFFLKNQCADQIFAQFSFCFLVKNAIFSLIFSAKVFKKHYIGPRSRNNIAYLQYMYWRTNQCTYICGFVHSFQEDMNTCLSVLLMYLQLRKWKLHRQQCNNNKVDA
jgi:hypothetical protein